MRRLSLRQGETIILDLKEEFTAVKRVQIKDLLKWRFCRMLKRKDLTFKVPHVEEVEYDFLMQNRSHPAVTWIGHSTFLIQISGLNIITDPIWASRIGLEKRLTKPGVTLSKMPPIDIILISHNHYDHLHYSSIRKLKGTPIYLVPRGLKSEFQSKGLKNVKEFSWWDCMYHKEVKITFLPTLHWSKRKLNDLNTTLWGGWMIENADKTIYFVGDSGYHQGFKLIGKKFAIDYALIPIGAYEPEWFMKKQHVNPGEAVQVFQELGAKYFIPMHYDAFRMADDTPKEALERLEEKWQAAIGDRESLKILKLGETLKM